MFLHTDLALALCIISIRSLRGFVLSCAGNHGERGPELAAESVLKRTKVFSQNACVRCTVRLSSSSQQMNTNELAVLFFVEDYFLFR